MPFDLLDTSLAQAHCHDFQAASYEENVVACASNVETLADEDWRVALEDFARAYKCSA